MRADRRGDNEDFVLTSQKGGQLSVARLGVGLLEPLDERLNLGRVSFRNVTARFPMAVCNRVYGVGQFVYCGFQLRVQERSSVWSAAYPFRKGCNRLYAFLSHDPVLIFIPPALKFLNYFFNLIF